jgi:hypothetical protein
MIALFERVEIRVKTCQNFKKGDKTQGACSGIQNSKSLTHFKFWVNQQFIFENIKGLKFFKFFFEKYMGAVDEKSKVQVGF